MRTYAMTSTLIFGLVTIAHVARMVTEIADIDRESIRALEHIVAIRRAAAHAAEQAETTLAAYGRAVGRAGAPRRTAVLVDRRG